MYIFFLGAQTKWAKKGFHNFLSLLFSISACLLSHEPNMWINLTEKYSFFRKMEKMATAVAATQKRINVSLDFSSCV